MEGTARGGKIKVRNLADNKVHEVKAKTVRKVNVGAPAKKAAPPRAVRDLEQSTRGLVNRTGERLGTPAAPSAPSAPSASRSPNLPGGTRRRPVTPSAPHTPGAPAARGVNLPGRKSGEDLAVGHQFHAKSADGKSVRLTVSGKSRRADGGHTVLGTDDEGNTHRVVVPTGSSVRTVRPGAASTKPDTANVPEPPAHPKPPGASGGNAKLDDLEAEAAKNGEIVLYHGGLPEGTSLDDIQLSRAGTQQNKKGRSYGGFYLTDSGSKDWSTDYAKGRNGVMHGFRVSKDAKVGDLGGKNIDRLSNEERASLAEQYDVVKGKDTLGRDQYVLLNKDAIAGVGETNVGTGRTGNVGTQAASAALVAADDGGPAQRTAADYGYKAKKGRKVATEAGAKRYGLPIGTPLGQGNKALASDSATAKAYETFMAANTPADLNKAAGWMSNDDLAKASKGLFSFNSTNERDQAGRIALVKELAARGIDPHQFGYKGGPVVLNPNPKQDPVAKAADTAQRKADSAQKKADSEKAKADKAVQQTQVQAQKAQAQADKDAIAAQAEASRKLVQQAHDALAQDIASGKITEKEARQRMAVLK